MVTTLQDQTEAELLAICKKKNILRVGAFDENGQFIPITAAEALRIVKYYAPIMQQAALPREAYGLLR